MSYAKALRAVLHVDPVVELIPDAFNSKEKWTNSGMGNACQWFNEEWRANLPLAIQNENPGMNTPAT